MWRFHKLIRVTSYLSGFGMLFFSQWQMELEQFRISGLNILLMEDIRNNHLTCMKLVVNNRINYSSLNWWFFLAISEASNSYDDPILVMDCHESWAGLASHPENDGRQKKTSHGGESRLKQKTYMCFFWVQRRYRVQRRLVFFLKPTQRNARMRPTGNPSNITN